MNDGDQPGTSVQASRLNCRHAGICEDEVEVARFLQHQLALLDHAVPADLAIAINKLAHEQGLNEQ